MAEFNPNDFHEPEATEAQLDYIESLAEQAGCDAEDVVEEVHGSGNDLESLTIREASEVIDRLKEILHDNPRRRR